MNIVGSMTEALALSEIDLIKRVGSSSGLSQDVAKGEASLD